MKHKGEPSVAACYFGDGSTLEGDFHEACNLAGVLKAPVIQSARTTSGPSPRHCRSKQQQIADRAAGYGIAGVRADGNNPLAMYQVTADARVRALAGEGPTLIEAVTYRLGAHTTADDPTRYVDPAEEQRWKLRDPLIRFRAWMRATGRWDDDAEEQAKAWCAAEIDRAVAEVAAVGPRPIPCCCSTTSGPTNPPDSQPERAELVEHLAATRGTSP